MPSSVNKTGKPLTGINSGKNRAISKVEKPRSYFFNQTLHMTDKVSALRKLYYFEIRSISLMRNHLSLRLVVTVKVQNTTCKPCFSNYAFVQFQQNFYTIGVLSVSVSCVLN